MTKDYKQRVNIDNLKKKRDDFALVNTNFNFVQISRTVCYNNNIKKIGKKFQNQVNSKH